jgi:hypothetical protein
MWMILLPSIMVLQNARNAECWVESDRDYKMSLEVDKDIDYQTYYDGRTYVDAQAAEHMHPTWWSHPGSSLRGVGEVNQHRGKHWFNHHKIKGDVVLRAMLEQQWILESDAQNSGKSRAIAHELRESARQAMTRTDCEFVQCYRRIELQDEEIWNHTCYNECYHGGDAKLKQIADTYDEEVYNARLREASEVLKRSNVYKGNFFVFDEITMKPNYVLFRQDEDGTFRGSADGVPLSHLQRQLVFGSATDADTLRVSFRARMADKTIRTSHLWDMVNKLLFDDSFRERIGDIVPVYGKLDKPEFERMDSVVLKYVPWIAQNCPLAAASEDADMECKSRANAEFLDALCQALASEATWWNERAETDPNLLAPFQYKPGACPWVAVSTYVGGMSFGGRLCEMAFETTIAASRYPGSGQMFVSPGQDLDRHGHCQEPTSLLFPERRILEGQTTSVKWQHMIDPRTERMNRWTREVWQGGSPDRSGSGRLRSSADVLFEAGSGNHLERNDSGSSGGFADALADSHLDSALGRNDSGSSGGFSSFLADSRIDDSLRHNDSGGFDLSPH